MRLRVTAIKQYGPNVRKYSLENADGRPLPPITPGTHLELVSPGTEKPWVRQYSLTNYVAAGNQPDAYEIAIQCEADGRGGSKWFHGHLHTGAEIEAHGPVNDFPLDDHDGKTILIAGGIGVTPILAMARARQAQGRPFDLHFFCRDAAQAPLMDEIQALSSGQVTVHEALDPAKTTTALKGLFTKEDPELTQVYVCGPAGLLDTTIDIATAAGWNEKAIRFERFSATTPSDDEPFTAVVAGTGQRIEVADNESLLEALARHGIEVASSCQTGTCGTCLTMVLDGEVDHRDTILSPDERAENSMMCVCVSRAACGKLLIDL